MHSASIMICLCDEPSQIPVDGGLVRTTEDGSEVGGREVIVDGNILHAKRAHERYRSEWSGWEWEWE